MSEISQMKTDLAVLRNDIDNIEGLFDRLDTTIEKLTEVSSAVNKILAVHESRLDTHEEKDREMSRMINEQDKRWTEMYEKFSIKIEKSLNEIKEFQTDHHDAVSEKIQNVSNRVDKIEQYRYILFGAIVAISIFSKEIGSLIHLF